MILASQVWWAWDMAYYPDPEAQGHISVTESSEIWSSPFRKTWPIRVCESLCVTPSLVKLQSSRSVSWRPTPSHSRTPLLCSGMMSLRIPSWGPLSAHKMPFLQLNTYGFSSAYGYSSILWNPPPPTPAPAPLPSLLSLSPLVFEIKVWKDRGGSKHTPPSDGFLQTAPSNDVTQTKICKQKEKRNRSVEGGAKETAQGWTASRKIGRKSAPECSVYMTSCTFFDYLL